MKLGIMQPYFMPYIGYWQLINLVDRYVIYDDVNFINRGWINRNRILVELEVKYINVPMLGASQNKLINEILVNNNEKLITKNLRTIECSYKKAPYFDFTMPIMEKILRCKEKKLSNYIVNSITLVCDYLDIKTELILSSSLEKNCCLRGKEKIISICDLLGASEYYNAIGGRKLYNKQHFKENAVELNFIQTEEIWYKQFGSKFISNLSIIDVMMFNSKEEIQQMLLQYEIISP